MVQAITWLLAIELVGLLAVPFSWRLLRKLRDGGFAFSWTLGLLVAGYTFWIGASLHFWRAGLDGIVLGLAAVAAISAWALWGRSGEFLAWIREQKRILIAEEALFLGAFALWAVFKAYNPAIAYTEKPMEFAFLNGILRSRFFPPLDPWLSGYAISYYYFGYVILAFLTRLSGVQPSYAFNLGLATWFAMSATGAFGLTFDLLSLTGKSSDGLEWVGGGLSAIALVLMGNLEGVFEVLHSRGIGSPGFCNWLDIKGLSEAAVSGGWAPSGGWWWWRASRVVHDKDLLGRSVEVIDEFPQFSFLLGDMHPHVLALPFGLLALGVILVVVIELSETIRGLRLVDLLLLPVRSWRVFLLSLVLGGMAFMNTWDFPMYWLIFVVFLSISTGLALKSIYAGVSVGVLGVVLYLPFYVGFSSQAGGALPNLFFPTRWQQYLVMWLPLGFMVVLYLIVASGGGKRALKRLPELVLYATALPILVWVVSVVAALAIPSIRSMLNTEPVRSQVGTLSIGALLSLTARVRLSHPWTFLLLALLVSWAAALILEARPGKADGFVLTLVFVGFLLQFLPEFVYLKDSFGTRMNTVFKFYFLSWVLLSVAAGYSVVEFWRRTRRRIARVAAVSVAGVLLAAGMVYPAFAIPSKAGGFHGRPTLDGLAYLRQSDPAEYKAIKWLEEHAEDTPTILEATGGSYTEAARVSEITGFPTLLGWGGHELQWRGSYDVPAVREKAIGEIYSTAGAPRLRELLKEYGIEYVYVGRLETEKYHISKSRMAVFDRVMEKVYDADGVRIYRRRP